MARLEYLAYPWPKTLQYSVIIKEFNQAAYLVVKVNYLILLNIYAAKGNLSAMSKLNEPYGLMWA